MNVRAGTQPAMAQWLGIGGLLLGITHLVGASCEFSVLVSLSVFSNMPIPYRQAWDAHYEYTLKNYFEGKPNELFLPIPNIGHASATLGKRYATGDEHARTLVELGFQLQGGGGEEPKLLPPPDASTLFRRFRARVREWQSQGKMGADDTLDMALAFRPVLSGKPVTGSYHFVRPGIDPWPDPAHWQILPSASQLPHRDFYSAVAHGKIPFFLTGFMSHDLAHLTELYLYPEIMKYWRAYARQVMSGAGEPKNSGAHSSPSSARNRSYGALFWQSSFRFLTSDANRRSEHYWRTPSARAHPRATTRPDSS